MSKLGKKYFLMKAKAIFWTVSETLLAVNKQTIHTISFDITLASTSRNIYNQSYSFTTIFQLSDFAMGKKFHFLTARILLINHSLFKSIQDKVKTNKIRKWIRTKDLKRSRDRPSQPFPFKHNGWAIEILRYSAYNIRLGNIVFKFPTRG